MICTSWLSKWRRGRRRRRPLNQLMAEAAPTTKLPTQATNSPHLSTKERVSHGKTKGRQWLFLHQRSSQRSLKGRSASSAKAMAISKLNVQLEEPSPCKTLRRWMPLSLLPKVKQMRKDTFLKRMKLLLDQMKESCWSCVECYMRKKLLSTLSKESLSFKQDARF